MSFIPASAGCKLQSIIPNIYTYVISNVSNLLQTQKIESMNKNICVYIS